MVSKCPIATTEVKLSYLGLKISAFKDAHISRHSDQELCLLARYLELIAKHSDFSEIDHKLWKSFLSQYDPVDK
jgi:hypothetical protein